MATKKNAEKKDINWLARCEVADQKRLADIRKNIADAELLAQRYEDSMQEKLAAGDTDGYNDTFLKLSATRSAIAGYEEMLKNSRKPYSAEDVREVWSGYLTDKAGEISSAIENYNLARDSFVSALLALAATQNEVNRAKRDVSVYLPKYTEKQTTRYDLNDLLDPSEAEEKVITVKVPTKPLEGGVFAPRFSRELAVEFAAELRRRGIAPLGGSIANPLFSVFAGVYEDLPQ